MAANSETRINLLSVEEQTEILRRLNAQYWGNRIDTKWFNEFDTTSDHIQSSEDLEVVYFDFGTVQESLKLWWLTLYSEIEPGTIGQRFRADEVAKSFFNDRYPGKYGIRRVRLNLTANRWTRGGATESVSVNDVRRTERARGRELPHIEVVAALALNQGLMANFDTAQVPVPLLGGLSGFTDEVPAIHYDWRDGTLALSWGFFARQYVNHTSIPVFV